MTDVTRGADTIRKRTLVEAARLGNKVDLVDSKTAASGLSQNDTDRLNMPIERGGTTQCASVDETRCARTTTAPWAIVPSKMHASTMPGTRSKNAPTRATVAPPVSTSTAGDTERA